MPVWDSLARSLSQLTWRSLVDILIVAVLIYQSLRLVRGIRAGQMLTGLLLLATASYLAHQWGLATLDLLLGELRPYLGFLIIVLFQAEIRRGLAELGGVVFFRNSSGMGHGSPYEDVVLAVSRFSQDKIGALIVLERRTGLRTHIESGVALEARLSFDLLVTVFRKGAPLHDGAAIVRKDKLAAAACFLPLSVNPERPRELGSRHRAALGITEETDAVAVVVSEQTGMISVAVEGTIEQDLSEQALRDRLSDLFRGRRAPGLPAVKEAGLGVIEGGAESPRASRKR